MENIATKYEFAVIATDTVLFAMIEDELKVLLIEMNKFPFVGSWAAPGGLVKANESVDEAARRNFKERAGVVSVYTEQLYTFGKINRDPFGRVVSVAYMGLTADKDLRVKAGKEYKGIKWFNVYDLPKLAYDHDEVIATALERLRSKLEYTNIVFKLLPKEFTMHELQKTYEVIRGEKLDKRNFQKKVLKIDMVEKLDKKQLGSAHRPAQLFTAKNTDVVQLNVL